jgi:hypothetical protein
MELNATHESTCPVIGNTDIGFAGWGFLLGSAHEPWRPNNGGRFFMCLGFIPIPLLLCVITS